MREGRRKEEGKGDRREGGEKLEINKDNIEDLTFLLMFLFLKYL